MPIEKIEINKHAEEIANLKTQARLRISNAFKNRMLIGIILPLIAFLLVGFLVWNKTPEKVKENIYAGITNVDAINQAVTMYPIDVKYHGSNRYTEDLSRGCLKDNGSQISECKP